MTPAEFVATVRGEGGEVILTPAGTIKVRAPRRFLTDGRMPRVVRYLEKHKPDLLDLLREREREREPDELLRESYLIAAARLGALPVNLPAPLRLPSGRVAANVNGFVRGSVERWRHAQAKADPDALAFAGTTWRDVAEQEAADLDACAARFAADPRDFDADVLAHATA